MRAPLTPPRPPHAGPNLVLQALTFKLAWSWGGALQGCPLPFSAPSRGATGARGVAWPAGPHGLGRSCAGSQTSATPLCSPAGQVRLARCRHVGPSGPPLFSICPAPRPPASLPRFRSPARTERGGPIAPPIATPTNARSLSPAWQFDLTFLRSRIHSQLRGWGRSPCLGSEIFLQLQQPTAR